MSKARLLMAPILGVFGIALVITVFLLPKEILPVIGPYVMAGLPFLLIFIIAIWAIGNFCENLRRYRELQNDE